MKIFSIDTSSPICSVAILENSNILYEDNLDSGLTHSENLMPMIKKALDKTKLSLNEIDLFACGKGPGSFTGIRIGISTIKAFLDVVKKPAIGVSSLRGLAYCIEKEGYIASLIDARNDQVYFGLFKKEKDAYSLVCDYRADSIASVLSFLSETFPADSITFVGDGSVTRKEIITASFLQSRFANKEQNDMKATKVGRAAYDLWLASSMDSKEATLSPLYLRKSSAERLKNQKEDTK